MEDPGYFQRVKYIFSDISSFFGDLFRRPFLLTEGLGLVHAGEVIQQLGGQQPPRFLCFLEIRPDFFNEYPGR